MRKIEEICFSSANKLDQKTFLSMFGGEIHQTFDIKKFEK